MQEMIIFKNVNKTFVVGREDRLKLKLSELARKNRKIDALKNISFSVAEKETVGFYGPNGSGKSTILRLIAGILKPDKGAVIVDGKVSPVLELGSGLHPELSGIDNIYLYSSILGVDRNKVKNSISKIISFSELAEFIDVPIKKYSAGMRARLGFSIAIFSNPDILLVDEVLSVGDQDFRQKCLRVLSNLKKKITIVLVSHDLSLLKAFADRVLHLQKGVLLTPSEGSIKTFLKSLSPNFEFKTVALSESMNPHIKKGDEITIKRVSFRSLKVGDVIAFDFENISHFIVHRIVGKLKVSGRTVFVTKGDSMYAIDPWLVEKSNYVGKVVSVKRGKTKSSLSVPFSSSL